MYKTFSFTPTTQGDVEVIRLSGYLADDGGAELKTHFDSCLEKGLTKFILDCSSVELISSPGVAALLEISSGIVDDFDGQIAVFGLDSHHLAVMEMAGFFYLAHRANDENEAKTIVNNSEG